MTTAKSLETSGGGQAFKQHEDSIAVIHWTHIELEDLFTLFPKDKASRIERIVGEHRLFSEGLKELQDWVCEAQRVISACTSSTTDKGVLEDRMLQLEVRMHTMDGRSDLCIIESTSSFHVCVKALRAARQEREIQLKMLLTRGEAVQRNTSAEGVPVIRKQIQDLKDSWDSLLSASIQCKRLKRNKMIIKKIQLIWIVLLKILKIC